MSRSRDTRGIEEILSSESEESISKTEELFESFDRRIAAPFRILLKDWRGVIGLSILGFYVLMGTVGVALLPLPRIGEGPELVKPFTTLEFPLGTSLTGRGLLKQVVHATPAMLKMATGGSLFAGFGGLIVGVVSGYKRGVVDRVLMTIADTAMNLPGLPLVIVLTAVFPPENPFVVGILLSITGWAGGARTLRAEVLSIRHNNFVEASRTMGLSTARILRNDIIPSLLPLVLIRLVGAARNTIFGAVALYFIGVLPFSNLNWGVMMNTARGKGALYSFDMFHWILIPMATITILSIGLMLLAQSFDRVLNPRLRAKHATTVTDEEAGADPE